MPNLLSSSNLDQIKKALEEAREAVPPEDLTFDLEVGANPIPSKYMRWVIELLRVERVIFHQTPSQSISSFMENVFPHLSAHSITISELKREATNTMVDCLAKLQQGNKKIYLRLKKLDRERGAMKLLEDRWLDFNQSLSGVALCEELPLEGIISLMDKWQLSPSRPNQLTLGDVDPTAVKKIIEKLSSLQLSAFGFTEGFGDEAARALPPETWQSMPRSVGFLRLTAETAKVLAQSMPLIPEAGGAETETKASAEEKSFESVNLRELNAGAIVALGGLIKSAQKLCIWSLPPQAVDALTSILPQSSIRELTLHSDNAISIHKIVHVLPETKVDILRTSMMKGSSTKQVLDILSHQCVERDTRSQPHGFKTIKRLVLGVAVNDIMCIFTYLRGIEITLPEHTDPKIQELYKVIYDFFKRNNFKTSALPLANPPQPLKSSPTSTDATKRKESPMGGETSAHSSSRQRTGERPSLFQVQPPAASSSGTKVEDTTPEEPPPPSKTSAAQHK